MPFNGLLTMDVAGQAGQTALFGLALWLTCALAGVGVGAAVAAAQIFLGRWHPAWAAKLVYWFSCPFFAGLATGVLLALKNVPPLAEARTFWLLLCLVIVGFTAVVAAGVVAYLSRNYHPNAVTKAKRVSRRSTDGNSSRASEWEDRLRSLFRPAPTPEANQEAAAMSSAKRVPSTIPGQKGKLPPARFPTDSALAQPSHYAGHPRQVRLGGGKLEKPSKKSEAASD